MAINEQSRHQLHQRLEALLGADDAATLMEHLPPVGWADVATKRDLDQLATMTKTDLRNLATELRGEMAVGFADIRTEMRTGFAEMRTGFAELRAELYEQLGLLRGQSKTMFLGLVGLQVSAAGLVVGASKLL